MGIFSPGIVRVIPGSGESRVSSIFMSHLLAFQTCSWFSNICVTCCTVATPPCPTHPYCGMGASCMYAKLIQWHGFLAPHELPRELASLVLMVTLSLPAELALLTAGGTNDVERTGNKDVRSPSPPLPPPSPSLSSSPLSLPLLPPQRTTALQTDRPLPPPASTWWALDSFDERLACPRGLISAIESLLSAQYRHELDALVRRSAFVLPGREGTALLGLRALGDGDNEERDWWRGGVLFLVAVLPVLEHGLRCLFSCANDSPEHLLAHLRQYYSTLDGVRMKFLR